jgi:nucleoside-diphosphate kinase
VEKTLAILKPDVTRRNLSGRIIHAIEEAGFHLCAMKMVRLSREMAEEFYSAHSSQPFFGGLIEYMCSGPVVVMALDGDGVVTRFRTLLGSTDPKSAMPGTLRSRFGENVRENSVHGSDSALEADREVSFFFAAHEFMKR